MTRQAQRLRQDLRKWRHLDWQALPPRVWSLCKTLNWPLWATGLYVATLAALTLLNLTGADRFWLGALNLYLPQAMWGVPGIILAIVLYKKRPSLTWLPLLCLLWVVGPIMGFKFSLSAAKASPAAPRLRVMTWNIKYGFYDLAPLQDEVTRQKPDVVMFQDAFEAMKGPLKDYFRNWQVRYSGQYVIASRYPLSPAEELELPQFGWSKQSFLRCRMYVGPNTVTLYNVHFKTPRHSLNNFRMARKKPSVIPEAIERFDHNVTTRFLQALAVSGNLHAEQGPVIVAGDLNSPDSALACRTLRDAGLHDAFAEGGTGYGFTYGQLLLKHRLPWLRLSWMRIDHIMLPPSLVSERCWTGTGLASDHRPVIADLVFAKSK